jgi:hypothetical protein
VYCCIPIYNIPRRKNTCASYANQRCGLFEGYGEMLSECCTDDNGSLSVLYCAGGTSMTWHKCPSGFECIQRMGITSGKKRALVPYAQCEVSGG